MTLQTNSGTLDGRWLLAWVLVLLLAADAPAQPTADGVFQQLLHDAW